MSNSNSYRISPVMVQSEIALGTAREVVAAHRPTDSRHRDLGKRLAKRRRGMTGSGLKPTGTGELCSFRMRSEHRAQSGVLQDLAALPLAVGDPAAALWASLVVSRALSS